MRRVFGHPFCDSLMDLFSCLATGHVVNTFFEERSRVTRKTDEGKERARGARARSESEERERGPRKLKSGRARKKQIETK